MQIHVNMVSSDGSNGFGHGVVNEVQECSINLSKERLFQADLMVWCQPHEFGTVCNTLLLMDTLATSGCIRKVLLSTSYCKSL